MKVFTAFAVFILAIALYAIITAFPVMWLWNYCLVPAIPSFKVINFWQAWGIKLLFNILIHVTHSTDNKK